MRTLNTGPPGITVTYKRHKPPVSPMDVAFLVPGTSEICSRYWQDNSGSGRFWPLCSGDYRAFLALRLVVPRRDPGASALIRAAYIGELGKLALTVLMFGIVFALVRPIEAAPLFAGFIAAQLATIAGLVMRDKNERNGRTSKQNGE